jgi:hypothetical protein
MGRAQRHEIARRRIRNILAAHIVANARTLENKISDAGPFDQRIEPHVVTESRQDLERLGIVRRKTDGATVWFHLASAPENKVHGRLQEQHAIHALLVKQSFTSRLGQTLEIAVFKALRKGTPCDFYGGFPDLDDHDDSLLYAKEEPPGIVNAVSIPGKKRLDFFLVCDHIPAGIEAKNIREWLYPHSDEVRDLLLKCCAIRAVPVLIARRLPFVTFSLMHRSGVVIHQMYNQLFPAADAELAALARNKKLLGYHDIRLGNEPDGRLQKFISTNLPKVLPAARERFEAHYDLLSQYGGREIEYPEFSKRLLQSN